MAQQLKVLVALAGNQRLAPTIHTGLTTTCNQFRGIRPSLLASAGSCTRDAEKLTKAHTHKMHLKMRHKLGVVAYTLILLLGGRGRGSGVQGHSLPSLPAWLP